MLTTSAPEQAAAARRSVSMGPGAVALSASITVVGPPGSPPRKRMSPSQVSSTRRTLPSIERLPAADRPLFAAGHSAVVPNGIQADGPGCPGERSQEGRVEQEGQERETLTDGHRFTSQPGWYCAGSAGDGGDYEGNRRDDVPHQHACDLVPLEAPRECNNPEGAGHEQLVGDRIEDRAERG